MSPLSARPSAAQFRVISDLVSDVAGIVLPPGKEALVRSRLARRLRACGVAGYAEYLALVRDPAAGELAEMVDALTTNETRFFREPAHFDRLRDELQARPPEAPLRLWSAGCASGEEAYTIAMLAHDDRPRAALGRVPPSRPRILATDLSGQALARARAGTYDDLAHVPASLRERHFVRRERGEADDGWEVAPHLRSLVAFARLNLLGPWPMRGPFHAIFCRNVMIYFDRPTQQALVERFRALLAPGGLLFVGHAESLGTGRTDLRYVQPGIYRR